MRTAWVMPTTRRSAPEAMAITVTVETPPGTPAYSDVSRVWPATRCENHTEKAIITAVATSITARLRLHRPRSPDSCGVKAEPSITPITTSTPLRPRPGERSRTPARLVTVVAIMAPSSHGSGRLTAKASAPPAMPRKRVGRKRSRAARAGGRAEGKSRNLRVKRIGPA